MRSCSLTEFGFLLCDDTVVNTSHLPLLTPLLDHRKGAATPKRGDKRPRKVTLADQMRENPAELRKRFCWVFTKLLKAQVTKLVEAGVSETLHNLVLPLWVRYMDTASKVKPKVKKASGTGKEWDTILPRFELQHLPPLSHAVAMCYIGLRLLRAPLLLPDILRMIQTNKLPYLTVFGYVSQTTPPCVCASVCLCVCACAPVRVCVCASVCLCLCPPVRARQSVHVHAVRGPQQASPDLIFLHSSFPILQRTP